MERWILGLGGFSAGLLIDSAWRSWPGHEAFRVRILGATSPTGEPEKSPLAFVEHYHYGLASLLLARRVKPASPILGGFGAAMFASELSSPNPFGIGKSGWEVAGNVALSSLLLTFLFSKS
jgi:hypothetical protein